MTPAPPATDRLERFAQLVYDVCTKSAKELTPIMGVAYHDDHQRLNHLAELAADYLPVAPRGDRPAR